MDEGGRNGGIHSIEPTRFESALYKAQNDSEALLCDTDMHDGIATCHRPLLSPLPPNFSISIIRKIMPLLPI